MIDRQMEKKRKLPARAAARVEQNSAKKRTATPPENRSSTPAPAAAAPAPAASVGEEPSPHALPKSNPPGKPLPTIEQLQPDDPPSKDYQSVQERYVVPTDDALQLSLSCSGQN